MFGAVISLATSAVATVTKALSTIGPVISSFAARIGPFIGSVMDKIPGILSRMADFASTFLALSGVFKPDETVQDMGEAALQAAADDITPDRFDDFDDYMNELRNYEIDPQVAEERSAIEKTVAGMGIGSVGLEQKYDAQPGSFKDVWLLPLANPGYFTPERMKAIVAHGTLAHSLYDFLNNNLSGGQATELKQDIDSRLQDGATDLDASTALYEALDDAETKLHKIAAEIQQDQ